MPTQWIDLKVTLDRIRLKAYQRDRVHYCEYIAVVCIDEEDGLEILCRAKGDNEFRFGCRATGRVPCTASIEPGDLDEVFVKFYQTLFIPYATPSVEKDGFLTFPSRVYVWLFEVGFPKDVLISREKQTSGQFNESGRLIIPCTDVPLTMMMKFPYKHMPDLSRNSFILSLVGISLLLDNRKSYPQSSFCLSESLDEDSTVQQTYEHEHSPFNTPLYNGKSLFYFFSGTCVLPSWINSTKLTVPILIGEVSGRCSIIPSSFTSQLPLFPGNRRSLFGKDRLNDESTKSRCFPMIRGIRFHFKRIIGLPLRSFVQGQVPATIPTADIFQALQGKHLFRAMWRNDSEQATHNLDDEGYLGHLLKEHDGTGPPMHGQWIVCSNQVVFTSLKDMTNTQLVCVDFNISEQVFMTLPLGGQYELQCYFWVKPTVRVSGITLKEMVVLTLQQPLSVLSHIDDASLYIPLCECGSPEGCQVSLHLSLHGIPAPETSVTHSVHRRLGLPTQEHQPSSYRLGIQGIQATYNNVYSILTRYLKPDENQKLPGRMIQIQSEDVEDAGGGIRSWCQFLLCEKNEDRKLSELSVVDAKHVWIISGNPESHVVAGKSYLFDLDVDPFHSQSKTIDKAFFCKSLTVDIIDEGALTLRVDQGTHAWGASRANDRLEWRVEPSNYLSTLSCRFLRVGSYLLHIRVGGRDIVSSPFSIRCIAGRPDSSKTRLEVFPCLASVLGSCRSSVFSSMFSSYRTSLNPPLYINKLGFQLRDALENPVKMAYSVFSAQSLTQGLDVLHVINYENGTYDVLYRITLTPSCLSNCLDLPPTFRVVAYVNGRTVGGFPLTLNPENMNEINEYYRQLEEVTEQPLWELEALLKKNDVFQAKHYLKSYREQWCKNVRTSAQTIEAVIQQLQTLQDATKTLLSTDTCVSPAILSTGECSLNIKKAQQALDQLKKRWILSHTLREQLKGIQEDLILYRKSEASLVRGLSVLVRKAEMSLSTTEYELTVLKDFKKNALEVLFKNYTQMFNDINAEKITDIMYYMNILSSGQLGSVEELVQLQLSIADELRRLNFDKEADMIHETLRYTLDDAELKYKENEMNAKAKIVDNLDNILKKKEDQLELVKQNVQQTKSQIQQFSDNVARNLPLAHVDNKEVQVNDPLGKLTTKLGPMVAYRATGKSPYASLPEDLSDMKQITEGLRMGPSLKQRWRSITTRDILKFSKILQSCPRIKRVLSEIFTLLSGTTYRSDNELQGATSRGIVWSTYKRFCLNLKLSPTLINDATALRHLFLKFSIESKTHFSSLLGFTRYIFKNLWVPLLRELAYLDTLAVHIDTNRTQGACDVNRFSCFYAFLSRRILPYYSYLITTSEHQFFEPLLPAVSVQNKDAPDDLRIDEINLAAIKEKIKDMLSIDLLKKIFRQLVNTPDQSENGHEAASEKIANQTITFRPFYLYLTYCGLCPGYIDNAICFKLCNRFLKEKALGISGYRYTLDTRNPPITFEMFSDTLCYLLFHLADEMLEHALCTEKHHLLNHVCLQMKDIISILGWGN